MNFKSYREIEVGETDDFKAFANDIDYLIEFFKSFSELLFFNGRIISFFTDKHIFNLNTDLIDSSAQTLRSIKLCCSIGSFSDANTLIRKLRDDLIQYVYVHTIINARKSFNEDDLQNIKFDNPEEFANSITNIRLNSSLTDDEKALSAWFSNTVSDLDRPIRKKLEFENYMKVLKQNSNIAHILEVYNLVDYWEILRTKLNDYVHNNGIKFTSQNSIRNNDKNLEIHLKNIKFRTSYISSFFVIALLMVDSSLISSTDYIDHLDCDLEPPEDSQYFIAGFMQEFIDTKVNNLHPEIKQYLIENNINGMRIG